VALADPSSCVLADAGNWTEEVDATEKADADLGDLVARRRMESKRESLEGVEGTLLSKIVVVREAVDVAYVSPDDILGRDGV
jgi:hypothetical protein